MILRLSFLSFQIPGKVIAVRLMLCALIFSLALITLRFGTYPLSSGQILGIFIGGGDALERMIVLENRLPRLLTAIGAGVAFGLAGALFQTMLRNPLASPDWIGFTPGASFGALLAIYLTGGHIIFGALIGIAATAVVVLLLSFESGLNVRKLVLIGIGANLSLAAAADLLLSRVDLMTAEDMSKWLVGALNGRDWSDAALIWGGLALLVPAAALLTLPLCSMMLTDDVARGHGVALTPVRCAVAVTSVCCVALGVCVAGPLPFVAFLSGPIAKGLEGDGKPSLLSAALVGAIVVLAADYASRLTPLVQLPTGVFTALIGAPCLLWVLVATAKKGRI
ncbi:MAG: iron chelate uptake ABC transporter family permease subunit [Pseudomonadota bacterium]